MKNVNICDKCIREDFQERLIRMFSSSNINVLLGSGFSRPLLSVLGKIETDLTKAKRDNNKDEIFRVEKEFFSSCMLPLRNIEEVMKTCPQRNKFIYSIIEIISARHSSILHKTLNFFTTNYDNLIEMSLEERNIDYFDGFTGRISSVFSTNNYGKIISKQSAINNKTSEIVSVNLIKLHGSLYWYKNNDKIIYKDFNERLERLELAKDDVDAFISLYEQEFLIVNPNEEKYNLTVLNETYYDQIRLMSNELDKNNTLLIVYGFSFNDRLVNEEDLRKIYKTVAFSDKASNEMIPILPPGGCVYSGTATNFPVLAKINILSSELMPTSENVNLEKIWAI